MKAGYCYSLHSHFLLRWWLIISFANKKALTQAYYIINLVILCSALLGWSYVWVRPDCVKLLVEDPQTFTSQLCDTIPAACHWFAP